MGPPAASSGEVQGNTPSPPQNSRTLSSHPVLRRSFAETQLSAGPAQTAVGELNENHPQRQRHKDTAPETTGRNNSPASFFLPQAHGILTPQQRALSSENLES